MSRNFRSFQEKRNDHDDQRGRFAESRSFFCTKNPLPKLIADMGAGARPCLKIEHDLIENALKIFLPAARK